MALDDLLAKLERGSAVTAVTGEGAADVTAKPAPVMVVSAVTAVTADEDIGGSHAIEASSTGTAPQIRASQWLLHFLDRDPLEVLFVPPVDHADALAAEANAVAAEPLPQVRSPVRTETSICDLYARARERGCSTCLHRMKPGLSAGYCGGGRNDLPGAYGLHHPLRKLPDDQGVTCASYRPHDG